MPAKIVGEGGVTVVIIAAMKAKENAIMNHKSVTGRQKKGKKIIGRLKKEEEPGHLKKPWMIGLQQYRIIMICIPKQHFVPSNAAIFVANQGQLF